MSCHVQYCAATIVDLNIPTLRCLLSRIEERAIQKVDFLPTTTQANKQVLIKSCISQFELSNYESDTNLLLLEVFGTPSKQCANDTAVIATDDALSITEFAAIGVNSLPQVPNKMLCFMLEGVFARNILRNTVVKSVGPTALYFVIDML